MHINNGVFNETVTKLSTILKKCILPNLNPASYLRFLLANRSRTQLTVTSTSSFLIL